MMVHSQYMDSVFNLAMHGTETTLGYDFKFSCVLCPANAFCEPLDLQNCVEIYPWVLDYKDVFCGTKLISLYKSFNPFLCCDQNQ